MILITSGEPAGIGPDIVLQLTQYQIHNPDAFSVPWVVLGDISLFEERAKLLNIPVDICEYFPNKKQKIIFKKNILWIWHIPLKTKVIPGHLNQENAKYVLEMLQTGTKACVEGLFDALVTAPIHKAIIADSLVANSKNTFSGHTEYFAELTNTPEVVMMLASDEFNLRVALVTTHLPLSEVPKAITQEKIINIIRIIDHDFKKYFKNSQSDSPHIFVSGLNPHAGENGHLGREEIEVIIPALQKIREEGIHVEGPFPADTLFTKPYLAKADVFLAMYHDQGLAVLKYAAFDNAVNITLGLPFIRTSVDHGTALDLAGKGTASENSLIKAIQMAEKMVKNKTDGYHE